MEIAAVIALFKSVPVIIASTTALISTITAIIELFKARKNKQAFQKVKLAMDGIIAGLELLPKNKRTKDAKDLIKQFSQELGTEDGVNGLAEFVDDIEGLFDQYGIKPGKGVEQISRAANAIKETRTAREKRKSKKKTSVKKVVGAAMLIMLPLLILLGCACVPTYTTETVWPGETGESIEIVVEWPEEVKYGEPEKIEDVSGVFVGDLYITEKNGFVITVAPLSSTRIP